MGKRNSSNSNDRAKSKERIRRKKRKMRKDSSDEETERKEHRRSTKQSLTPVAASLAGTSSARTKRAKNASGSTVSLSPSPRKDDFELLHGRQAVQTQYQMVREKYEEEIEQSSAVVCLFLFLLQCALQRYGCCFRRCSRRIRANWAKH